MREGEPLSILELDLQENHRQLASALKEGTLESREAALHAVRQAAKECGRRLNATHILVTDGDRWICLVDRRHDPDALNPPTRR